MHFGLYCVNWHFHNNAAMVFYSNRLVNALSHAIYCMSMPKHLEHSAVSHDVFVEPIFYGFGNLINWMLSIYKWVSSEYLNLSHIILWPSCSVRNAFGQCALCETHVGREADEMSIILNKTFIGFEFVCVSVYLRQWQAIYHFNAWWRCENLSPRVRQLTFQYQFENVTISQNSRAQRMMMRYAREWTFFFGEQVKLVII